MVLPTAVLAFTLSAGSSEVPVEPVRSVSVTEALELVRGTSPEITRSRAVVSLAKAHRRTAGTYPFNPVLEVGGARRRGENGDGFDRSAGVSQEVELWGHRQRRVEAAEASLEAARKVQERRGRLLSAHVLVTFARAVAARDLVEVARSDLAVAREFAEVADRRLQAGAASELETNLARAGLARAAAEMVRAEAAYGEAKALLGESVALEGEPLLVPQAELPDFPVLQATLRESLVAAEARRADLAALLSEITAAEARLRLARVRRRPNLTVSGFAAREEADDLFGVRLAMPLPIFQRSQGGIAAAEAALASRRAEADAGLLRVRQEVAAAHSRLRAATAAAGILQAELVTNLEDSLRLAERSFEVGKIGASELLLTRRELVEARRLALEARREAWIAGITLALAMGEDPAALVAPDLEEQP